ncbi:hypothetical protein QJQ45_024485 [Haematococcus lacustris]|nr:hypothetical protein QJQ45_024485 [Haematococcus lacustris]
MKAKSKYGLGASIGGTVALGVVLLVLGTALLPRGPGSSVPELPSQPGSTSPLSKHLHKPVNVPSGQITGPALLAEVAKQYPINKFKCGSWVQSYAKLHSSILSGAAPQRYSIMRSKQEFGNGLADRLATSVSILLYSILTDRAFLYDWEPPPPVNESMRDTRCGKARFYVPSTHLWVGLRSDFIDWRYQPVDVGNSSVVMDYNCDNNMQEYKELFRTQNLTAAGDGVHSVIWHADHAGVYAAFRNPFLASRLKQLGFERETAFACLFDFIYRPAPEVVQLFAPELNVLMNPNILKIGVQVRVGDWQLVDSYTFKPQHYPYLFRHYFECAKEIELALAKPGQPVVWYTLVDIPALRWGLAARYPDRLLINTNVVVEHIVKSSKTSDHGFLQAVGEIWVFSFTSQHIITKISGFGKVPGMVNANTGPGLPNTTAHFYTITHPMNFFNLVALNNRKNLAWWRGRKCGPQLADDIEQVTSDFTGI